MSEQAPVERPAWAEGHGFGPVQAPVERSAWAEGLGFGPVQARSPQGRASFRLEGAGVRLKRRLRTDRMARALLALVALSGSVIAEPVAAETGGPSAADRERAADGEEPPVQDPERLAFPLPGRPKDAERPVPGGAAVPTNGSRSAAEGAQPLDRPPGTVLTFYGLRHLEQDPTISDAEKIREWRAFIERATAQIEYAHKAIARWKEAAKLRLVEAARLADADEGLSPRQRIAQWKAVIDGYPRSEEAKLAERRIRHGQLEETARLVRAAERVESEGRPKIDRIQAWLAVIDWAPKSREARAAQRRVKVLQDQLFAEAESVDRIDRIDPATKLEAWQDVLRGRPTQAQRAKAERRIGALTDD